MNSQGRVIELLVKLVDMVELEKMGLIIVLKEFVNLLPKV